MNIGFFVTSHGFGHAARVCAVIEKLSKNPNFKFYLFTQVPKWFFENSLISEFEYFDVKTDVGLIQFDPFNEDPLSTLQELDRYYPFKSDLIQQVETLLKIKNISLIVSDISPLGIFLADKLRINSILIENFTWDWIYSFYTQQFPKFKKYIKFLSSIYKTATIHISCKPFCEFHTNSFIVNPVFREVRDHKKSIRHKLGCIGNEKLILISMGGIPIEKISPTIPSGLDGYKFIIPINKIYQGQFTDQFIYLPHNHGFYHPDLVNSSDLVVGKVGYSTLAEVYSLQKPFIYIGRKSFPESSILEKFIQENMVSCVSKYEEFFTQDWFERIDDLLSREKNNLEIDNGADQIARIINKNY